MAKAARQPVDNRQHYYTLLQVGKAQLGWDDEFYRGIWLPMQGASKVDGRYSASTMTIGELARAVKRMEDAGFKRQTKRKFVHEEADWRTPRIGKINKLWLLLYAAGEVDDKSQTACERWCAKYTKKDRLQWASSRNLNKCIEQLKKWAARVGLELEQNYV